MTEKLSLTSEQKQALDIDKNLLVLAGAGSGKTRVLTERYLKIIEESFNQGNPINPGNVLVVTFTEKAAGEMSDRIQGEIEEKIGGNWEIFSENFLDNQISTFHSFCARVLQDYPLESGIDPEFKVIEGFDQRQLLMETVEKEINHLSRVKDEGLKLLLLIWNRGQLEKTLVELVENRYEIQDTFKTYKALSPAEFLNRWFGKKNLSILSRDQILELLEPVRGFVDLDIPPEDKGISFLGKLFDIYMSLKKKDKAMDFWEEVIIFRDLVGLFINSQGDYFTMKSHNQVGTRGNWGEFEKEHQEAKKILRAIKDRLEKIIPAGNLDLLPTDFDLEAGKVLPHLAQITLRCIDSYQEAKKNNSFLDFNDLEGFTFSLVEQNPEITKKLGSRFKYIMVDEFQDTNFRQWEIIKRIWHQGEKSNLFLVGDIKQAIYSFRGGDVTIFNKGKDELEENGSSVVFSKNFRSCGKLIDFFNSFFSKLLQDCGEEFEAPFQRLEPDDEKKDLPGGVDAFILNKGGSRIEKMVTEADLVAEKAQELLPLLPEGSKRPRLAILLRSMVQVHHFEKALRKAGISFTTVRGRGFFNQQEIFDLCNLLFFLSDPRRDIELIGLLRSPLIGLSDRDIYNLSQIPGSTYYEKVQNTKGREWEEVKSQLSRWLFYKDRFPIGDLLQKIILEGRYYLFLNLGERKQQKSKNVEKFLELARKFSREGKSIGELNHFLQQQLETPIEEGEAVTEVETDIAIMSIHQAKGLQFPGVILANLGGQFNWGHGDPVRRAKINGNLEVGFGVTDPQTGLRGIPSMRKLIGKRLKAEQIAEEKRLFYVAATRAERYLFLVGSREKPREIEEISQGQSFLDWLEWACDSHKIEEDGALRVFRVDPEEDVQSEIKPSKANSLNFLENLKKEDLEIWEPKPLKRKIEIELSPTDISLYSTCPLKYYYQKELLVDQQMVPSLSPGKKRKDEEIEPLKFGELFHWVMETGNFETKDLAREEQMGKMKIPEGARHEYQRKLNKHLNKMKASGWLKRIEEAEEDIKEKDFRVKWKSLNNLVIYLKGIIDLLIKEEGKWKVIDYKTSSLKKKNIEEITLENNYHLQVACYMEALKCLKPSIKVEEAWIIYSSMGKGQRIRVGKKEIGHVVDIAKKIASRDFKPKKGSYCDFCEFFSLCPEHRKGGKH